jgi:hypothetical protein
MQGQKLTTEVALGNLQGLCDAYRGTKQEHQVLDQSLELVKQALVKPVKPVKALKKVKK